MPRTIVCLSLALTLALALVACTTEEPQENTTADSTSEDTQEDASPDTAETDATPQTDATEDDTSETTAVPDAEDDLDTEDDTVAPCPFGLADCDADPGNGCETAVLVDASNCGACGLSCPAGQVCDGAGSCAITCGAGLTNCDGACVDLANDRRHCGTCGLECEAGEICDGLGACALACQTELANCSDVCVSLDRDRINCGACGITCGAGEVCSDASCVTTCPEGTLNCLGRCTANDRFNCGGCGLYCDAGEVCGDQNTCVSTCPSGQLLCGGSCVDTDTDVEHCGGCDLPCSDEQTCDAGSCSSGPPLSSLSDDFEASTLGNWQRLYVTEGWGFDQQQLADIHTFQPGVMTLLPHAHTWYADYRGSLVYKLVPGGDFVATIDLSVSNRTGDGMPRAPFSLAGLMMRKPRDFTDPVNRTPNGEDYVLVALGVTSDTNTYTVESKTTDNSSSSISNHNGAAAGNDRLLLRIARVGSAFILLTSPVSGSWSVVNRYRRADLLGEVQVGITAYSDWTTANNAGDDVHNATQLDGNPDLLASIYDATFSEITLPVALEGKDLVDSGQVSDAELLGFLGFTRP